MPRRRRRAAAIRLRFAMLPPLRFYAIALITPYALFDADTLISAAMLPYCHMMPYAATPMMMLDLFSPCYAAG